MVLYLLNRFKDVLAQLFAADGATVTLDISVMLGFAEPLDDLVQSPDGALCGQRRVHVNAQAFTIEVVQDVQSSDRPTVCKLTRHEVYGACIVWHVRHRQRLRFVTLQAVLWLKPQVQLQFTVDLVNAFVVPGVALHVAQIYKIQPKHHVRLLSVNRYSQSAISSFLLLSTGL